MVRFHPAAKLSVALVAAAAAALLPLASAFNPDCDNNFAAYYGTDSYGNTHGIGVPGSEQPLANYCQDDTIDIVNLSFLHIVAPDGTPGVDFKRCTTTFNGTSLLHCPEFGVGIKACQARGKKVILSIGGGAGNYVLSSAAQARALATNVWNMFLGGSSATRPFDDAVLDGIDLDLEAGGNDLYATFVEALRALWASAPKRYYVSAAPQCPFPDGYMGPVLDKTAVDWLNVQFYNNYCSVGSYPNNFNWDQWVNWIATKAPNKKTKLLLGVPASPTAGGGYAAPAAIARIIADIRAKWPGSLGGIMTWDVSQSERNGNFGAAMK
ncbi:glycoside hydrolase, partial [Ramicandelaber brevisporus]